MSNSGLEVGCVKFAPERVHFRIKILENRREKLGSIAFYDFVLDVEKGISIFNTNEISVGFYPKVKYRVENITGQKIRCLKGDIGILD